MSALFEESTTTEETKQFILSNLLSLVIHLSQLPKSLHLIVRQITQRRGFEDHAALTLCGFLPTIQLRQLSDALKKRYQLVAAEQQVAIMNALRTAALTIQVIMRRQPSAELNAALKLYERLMESLVTMAVMSGSASAGVPLLFVSYLSLQIWMQRKPRTLFFPTEKTVELLARSNDLTLLEGLSAFIKKWDNNR